MRSGMGRRVLSLAMISVLVLGISGCRSKKAGMGEGFGDDYLDPLGGLDGGFALGPRGEFGTPVTDVRFETVSFAYDSFQIAGGERSKIEKVADYMLANSRVTVVVDGHCDERGSREYNLSLGEHRSLAVRAYLISLGVAGDRIQTRSFGAEQPLDPGHTEAAWARNRRAEFALYRP